MQTEQGSTHSYRRIRHGKRVSRGVMLFAVLAAACLRQTSASAQEIIQKAVLNVNGPVSSLSLNDNGWLTYSAGLGNDSQVYLWNGSTTATLSTPGLDNRDARINNNNWVVWGGLTPDQSTTQIYAWKGGGSANIISNNTDYGTSDEADSPTINNLNQIAWHGQAGGSGIDDIFFLRPGDTQATDLTSWDAEGNSYNPRLNDTGLLSYERLTEVNPGGEVNLILSALDTSVPVMTAAYQITDSQDLNVLNGGINNNGKLVWTQFNDALGKWDVWEFDPATGQVTDLSEGLNGASFDPAQGDPAVNDAGTVAWYTSYFTDGLYHQDLYWDQGNGAQLIPLNSQYLVNGPITLNNGNEFAYVSKNSSSRLGGYTIFVDAVVPEPGTLTTALGALVLPGVFLLRSRRQGRRSA